jgi:hypothetical protein
MCWSEGDMPDGVKAQLGTFYQVMDAASGLQQVSNCQLRVRVEQQARGVKSMSWPAAQPRHSTTCDAAPVVTATATPALVCEHAQDGEQEFAELIADDDRPRRTRLPVSRLLHFALGVALINLPLLLLAYGLLLLGLVFRCAAAAAAGVAFTVYDNSIV